MNTNSLILNKKPTLYWTVMAPRANYSIPSRAWTDWPQSLVQSLWCSARDVAAVAAELAVAPASGRVAS